MGLIISQGKEHIALLLYGKKKMKQTKGFVSTILMLFLDLGHASLCALPMGRFHMEEGE